MTQTVCPEDAALVAELRAELAVKDAMIRDLQRHARLQDEAIELLQGAVTDDMRQQIAGAGALT